jgi:hypothetical protein
MFSTSAFFQTLLCFLLFYRFFPLWQDMISGRGIITARFPFCFTDAAAGKIYLAFFPASVMMIAGHSARVSVTLV